MHIFYVLTAIAAGYCFIVFVLSRLVVPFMGFGKYPVPTEIPIEIKNKIAEL